MESTPLKRNVAQDEDMISALTDDLLLAILERLDLRDAVGAGAVSTRWRHLPHQLSCLELDARHFHGATVLDTMDAFTSALFRGKTSGLALQISPSPAQYTVPLIVVFGQQFMSFSCAYQVAFRWLTRLCVKGLAFGDSDVTDLISACDGIKQLTLSSRWMVEHSVLKIDMPCSGLQELKFINFGRKWIELVSVPKLRQVMCFCWRFENPPVRFGYVPELCDVTFTCQAKVWQAPFLLSECLLTSVTNPWKLHLHFAGQMIWIQPQHPKQLTAILRNLTDNEYWEQEPSSPVLIGLAYSFPSGQGTVCLKLLEQVPKIDTIIVPISGGGLIYGVALATKAINPSIRILAAEPVVRDLVDDVIVVDDNAIVDAMKMSYETLKVAVEPSGSHWPCRYPLRRVQAELCLA
ncbi:Serine racemase [Hordeum vulgare]|nr:Serine racemase [Hordeum vulgare]